MSPPFRLPDAARIGAVHLRIASLPRALSFYRDLLGLTVTPGVTGGTSLASGAAAAGLLVLREHPGARPKPPGTTGLYHFAVLVPDRRALARVLRRLRDAQWPLQGAADHAVSESLYLADPDGHGIEIYADRPPERWQRRGGELYMTTAPLDLQGLLAEWREEAAPGEAFPSGSRMGHVHLHVADLAAAEGFYAGLLGFDVTVRSYPGALFLSAGGYHHHIAVNVWAGEGAPRPGPDTAGLRAVELIVPGPAVLPALRTSLADAGVPVRDEERGFSVEDPDGNRILIISPSEP